MNSQAETNKRLPPMAIEAAQVVLSALMLCGKPDVAAFAETVGLLEGPAAFANPEHGMIYDAILTCAKNGAVDGFLVVEELAKRGVLEQIGGRPVLAEIISCAPGPTNGPHYAKIVADAHRLRRLISMSNETIERCHAATAAREPSIQIGHDAAAKLAAIISTAPISASEKIGDVAIRVIEQMMSGDKGTVPTGFPAFDNLTGGIGLGEMVVLGARTSMGKSTGARQIAIQAADAGYPVAFISQEESKEKIARNAFAMLGMIDNHKLRTPSSLNLGEWNGIHAARERLEKLPIHLNSSARTLRDVRAAATSMVSRYGCKLLVVDYLQRIGAPGETRYEKVTEASQGISDLIKELGVAGLVLAQISRESTKREDRRPTLTDLKESGQIEQDADGVVLLHREDYYHLDEPNYVPDRNADLIIAKWRDGLRNKVVRLVSDLRYQRFIGPGHVLAGEE